MSPSALLLEPGSQAGMPHRQSPSRMVWMDQARGVAIVLVVVFHGRTVQARFADVPAGLRELTESFDPFRMPLLVFLSGMLLSHSLAKSPGAYALGKARSIAWPYAVWSVASLAVVAELSADTVAAVLVSPLSHLWFLPYLLGYYALAWVLQVLRVPVLPVAAVALLSAGLLDGGWRRMTFLCAFFFAGHVYVQHQVVFERRAGATWLAVSGVVVVAGGAVSAMGAPVKYEPLLAAVPVGGIALCLLLARWSTGGPAARALAYVGRQSIVFYVSHFLTLWVVHTALDAAGVRGPVLVFLLGVSSAFAVGALLVTVRRRSRLVDALFRLPWPTGWQPRRATSAAARRDGSPAR